MATNNRIVDYNLKNLKVTDVAFETFLTNIQASENKYNLEALKECYVKLPIEWRNSEEIYIAGAWNTGNILGYNNVGGLISMPFSRSSIAHVFRQMDMYQVAENEPSLDQFYGGREYGYHVFEQLTTGGNITFSTMRSLNNQTNYRVANGYNFATMSRTLETNGVMYSTYNSGSMNFYLYIPNNLNISVWIDFTDLKENRVIVFYPSINSIGVNNPFINIYKDGSFNLHGALNNNNTEVRIITHNDRKLAFINIKNVTLSLTTSTAVSVVINSVSGEFVGDSSSVVKIGFGTTNINKPYLYDNSWDVSTVRNEDTLTISLTQPSDIFINTSKGAFTFYNQPAGIFDYKSAGVINCKIYNIAIKHV